MDSMPALLLRRCEELNRSARAALDAGHMHSAAVLRDTCCTTLDSLRQARASASTDHQSASDQALAPAAPPLEDLHAQLRHQARELRDLRRAMGMAPRVPLDRTDYWLAAGAIAVILLLVALRPPWAEAQRLVGGHGGTPKVLRCSSGEAIIGLGVSQHGDAIGSIWPVCRDGASDRAKKAPVWPPPEGLAGHPTGKRRVLRCSDDLKVIGVHGHADRYVRQLGLICESPGTLGDDSSDAVGARLGEAFDLRCPSERSISSLHVRAGALIDALGIGCMPDATN
jgi:hypothetical protein